MMNYRKTVVFMFREIWYVAKYFEHQELYSDFMPHFLTLSILWTGATHRKQKGLRNGCIISTHACKHRYASVHTHPCTHMHSLPDRFMITAKYSVSLNFSTVRCLVVGCIRGV
jgi:hypothetical protein